MVRWVGAWLLVAAVGLVAARALVRPERRSWMIVSVSRDETVAVQRFTVGNTGLFRDQLTTRVAVLSSTVAPLVHQAIAGPATLDDAGVHGALDGIERTETGFAWRVAGDSLRSRGSLTGGGPGCSDGAAAVLGVVDVPDAPGKGQNLTIDGRAFVVHTANEANANGGALYALAPAGALVLDPLASCPGLLALGTEPFTGPPPWIPPTLDAPLDLEFGGHQLHVVPGRRQVVESPEFDALLPERWLASLVGYHVPTTVIRRVHVSVDGASAWTGVLVLRQH